MGRASSSKKVARAARAAGRQRSRSNLLWPMSLVAVVALGAVLIFVSRNDRAVAEAPILGDHWHAAVGVYVCGDFVPNPNDAKQDVSGIHSHGDGLMHIHPFATRYTGDGANLAAFADTVGMEIEDDRLKLASGEELSNGDDCGGRPGQVQVKVWESNADQQGRLLEGGFADYAPRDGSMFTIAFVPEGTDIPRPPSAGNAPTDI